MAEPHGNETRPEPALDAKITRGQFLSKATAVTVGFGGLLGGLIAVPVAGMALAPAVRGGGFKPVLLGSIEEIQRVAEDRFAKVVLHPDAGSHDEYVKKRVAFVRWNRTIKDPVGLEGQGEYSVISNRCAHLGCPVQESNATFVCPCHGGAYDQFGRREAGPPTRSLDRFEWEVRDGEMWVVGEYSVGLDGKPASLRAPGQHANNIEGLLYPLQPSQL